MKKYNYAHIGCQRPAGSWIRSTCVQGGDPVEGAALGSQQIILYGSHHECSCDRPCTMILEDAHSHEDKDRRRLSCKQSIRRKVRLL